MPATTTALPALTDESWLLRCASVEQRDELLAYAARHGVPCWEHNHLVEESDLDLGWSEDLMAYSTIAYTAMQQVSVAEFKRMCHRYTAA